jgi:phosphoglycolate phosphatase
MNYKAVLFDLDGTLLDTIEDLADSTNAVLKKSGYPEHSVEKYKQFVGNGIRMLVSRALPTEKREDDLIDAYTAAMCEEYSKRWHMKTKPYEGIPELLDSLSSRTIKMAILSNKADEFTQAIVKKFLANWTFQAVFGERPNLPKKPDPKGALEIAGLMKLSPKEILYLGDSGTDMETASAAGMFPVGASWGFRSTEELVGHGAQAVIKTPLELLELL